MKNLGRIFWGLSLALLSAYLLSLSFSSVPVGFVIFFSFVPMLIGQYCILPEKVASLSPSVAISVWLGVVLIPIFGKMSIGMAAIPLFAAVIVFFVDRGKRKFHARTGFRWLVLEGVAGWVGLEMIRSFIPAIGTWLFVGYPLWRYASILQPLSVFGIFGLDILVMTTNYVIGLGIIYLINFIKKSSNLSIHKLTIERILGVWVMLLFTWFGFNSALENKKVADTQKIMVAAIQPNIPKAAHRDNQLSSEGHLATLTDMTLEASRLGPELIVWPEMGLGFDPQIVHTSELTQMAQESGAYIVIGYVVEDEGEFRNEAILLTPSGEFLKPYGKAHPMIASGEPRSILAGNFPTYETALGRLGIMICFDAHFTDVARALGQQGALIIANPALFGPGIADMTVSQVVFRAIENHTAVVMADVAYSSAIIDPYGNVIASTFTPEGTAKVLAAEISLGTGNSFYSHFGDWPGWVSLGGMIIFYILMNLDQKRHRNSNL